MIKSLKKILFLGFVVLFTSTCVWARADINYRLLAPESVETKNYYLVSLLEHLPKAREFVSRDPVLSAINTEKQKKLSAATTFEETIERFKFSGEEIEKIGNRLAELYGRGNVLDSVVERHLIPSGCYILLGKKFRGKDLLKEIWKQDAEGMNEAIDIYTNGKRPNYPAIDSISFNTRSHSYTKEILPALRQNVEIATAGDSLFFSVPLTTVRMALDLNDRMQAGDYEPLGRGENKKSYEQIKQTDWKKYPYTTILVLGAGPETAGEEISPEGRLRAAYAAFLYKKKQAPFIIVSGGKVHPYHTPYCEAWEMKKYLMERWDIPEEAIIIEPHARHTTTNVRNASRIMLREGIPADRPALITSSESHIEGVSSKEFEKRCVNELNLIPYRLGKKISKRALEFYPEEDALQINPSEPMDP